MRRMRAIIIFMEKLRQLLDNYIKNNEVILRATASNPRDRKKISKLRVRPISNKGALYYQAESFIGTKVFHKNIASGELAEFIADMTAADFRQLEVETPYHSVVALISRKGSVSIKEKTKKDKADNAAEGTTGTTADSGESLESIIMSNPAFHHNRQKKYILPQDEPIPFLVELGVQTPEGRIINSKYDKFKQINRCLEFVRDILPSLPQKKNEPIKIIDFGCGKSYLTFAIYYYLKIMNKYDISVIGLDLKKDVIENCQRLADKFGYDGLKFLVGDIGSYDGADSVDMVVTLHACDTATDYALAKAVKWNASVILSVPCCQHELNKQISCKELAPLLKYGIIKERMAALITDAIRANLLEEQGYDTQLLEFIDMAHTPKNILIRAVKRKDGAIKYGRSCGGSYDISELADFLNVSPTLKKLLSSENDD